MKNSTKTLLIAFLVTALGIGVFYIQCQSLNT